MTASGGALLLLSRTDIESLLTLEDCIEAVEEAFRRLAAGRAHSPAVLGYASGEGGFHVKACRLDLDASYFAVKVNGNFPENPRKRGMPTIQGLVVLADAESGRPLAVADSIEITRLRTAAATAVAARHLARPDSRIAALVGCGAQGPVQLRALAAVLPLETAFVFDADPEAAERAAADLSRQLGLGVRAVRDLAEATRAADVCVTCTPSRRAFLSAADVRPGTFLAAVGADAPEKREIDGSLMASARVVVDSIEQCAAIGELHHALEEGVMTREMVDAELAEIVAGTKAGRTSPREITVFDSTGVALEDVAAVSRLYEVALRTGRGLAWSAPG